MPSETPVSSIMTTDVVTLRPEDTLPAAADLLVERGIGAAPVVDAGGQMVGMLRDVDLLLSEANLHAPTVLSFLGADIVWPPSERRWEEEFKKAAASTVGERMITDFPRVAPGDSVEDVATLMHDQHLSHVPVVDGGQLVGIVARGDLVRFLAAST